MTHLIDTFLLNVISKTKAQCVLYNFEKLHRANLTWADLTPVSKFWQVQNSVKKNIENYDIVDLAFFVFSGRQPQGSLGPMYFFEFIQGTLSPRTDDPRIQKTHPLKYSQNEPFRKRIFSPELMRKCGSGRPRALPRSFFL